MTLVQSQNRRLLMPLAVPVALAGVPLAFRRTRWSRGALIVAGALLLVFVVLSLPSIGIFYLPATVAMIAAATASGRRAGGPSGQVGR
jgi:thiol:disulfide interchange protein